MSEERFSADWLALREAADHRARDEALLPPLVAAWRAGGWSRVLDLGSGTGSNLRYLSARLPHEPPRSWTLVDHDAGLLARAHAPSGAPADTVGRVVGDLAAEGLARVAGAHLVTASALLDLVSEGWLVRLVEACRAARAGVLLALSYDGTVRWSGEGDPDDVWVHEAVNAHQHRDKGLGAALGPVGGARAEALFREAGYRTWLLTSPWRLGADDGALAEALVGGWAGAAAEQRPDEAARVRAWHARRAHAVGRGEAGVTVGHVDLLALPAVGDGT